MTTKKNAILEMLRPGDLRMAGRSEEVVTHILSNSKDMTLLIDCLEDENEPIRMRCCDAMEKISRQRAEWFKPYKLKLIKTARSLQQKEVRWHLAQILPRLDLTSKQRNELYAIFHSYLEDKSSIVRTFAMQALTDLALQDQALVNETRELIKRLALKGTPAMQSRSRKLLKVLE